MTRMVMMAALPLAAAACGGGGGEQTAARNTAAPDDYVARVRALPPAQRDAVLFRAIRDAGQACQQVTGSTAIPDVSGAPAWTAKCDDGGTWVVALNPGGIATVTNAADLKSG
jgi:cytochrome c5